MQMDMRMNITRKMTMMKGTTKRILLLVSLVLVISIVLSGCIRSSRIPQEEPVTVEVDEEAVHEEEEQATEDTGDTEDTGQGALEHFEWSIEILDVGQGDASLIFTPNKDVIMIDGGEINDAGLIMDTLAMYEADDIDLLILSHPHADHIGGIEEVIAKYDVVQIVMPDIIATTKTFEGMIDEMLRQGKKAIRAEAGQSYNIDGVTVDILASKTVPDDTNNASVVAKVTVDADGTSMLFTGDIEREAEDAIIRMYPGGELNSDYLKVSHHGSNTSSTQKFIDAVSPDVAIISVGEGNRYGHPSTDVIDRLLEGGAEVHRTDIDGAYTLHIRVNK